jgi:hypothetical protein
LEHQKLVDKKGLFWNVRGLRKKGMAPYVRNLMQEQKLDFVCFQETITQDFTESCMRMVDPNRLYLWDWIPAKGKPCGFFTGISTDKYDVGG